MYIYSIEQGGNFVHSIIAPDLEKYINNKNVNFKFQNVTKMG